MSWKKEFDFLKKQGKLGGLTVFDQGEANELIDLHPGIPKEYLDFMLEIGHGEIHPEQFSIFSGLVEIDHLGLDGEFDFNDTVLFFADLHTGDLAGFNLKNNFSVVKFDHTSGNLVETGKTFREYMALNIGA